MGNDLFYFSAGKIASLIRRKELSPVEVVDGDWLAMVQPGIGVHSPVRSFSF